MLKVPHPKDTQTADILLGSFAATLAAVAESTDHTKRTTANELLTFIGQWREKLIKPAAKRRARA